MIHVILAVRDRKMGSYLRVFQAVTVGMAVRGFHDAVNDPQIEMAKHPDDYELWKLGTFDDESGLFTNSSEMVASGSNSKVKES